MSTDPRDRELNPQPIPPEPPEERRKGVSPLVWLLLLIAVLALGWYFYNRSVQTGTDTTPAASTTEPVIGSEQDNAARAEIERAAATETRRKERAAAKKAAIPADREVSPVASLQPDYPAAAFRNREEGTVLVRVDVDAQGNATHVDVAKRSGSRDLDKAAVEAVRSWKFNPAIKGGKQIAASAQVPVEFKLDQQ